MPSPSIESCIAQIRMSPDHQVIEHLEKALQYRNEKKSPDAVRNTYLRDLDIPQIVLFDILANRFPLVINAQQLITSAIIKKAKGKKHITIIDLGIGRGLQILRILDAFDKFLSLTSVTIIGIEIVPEALSHTTKLLLERKEKSAYELSFQPLLQSVEAIEPTVLSALIPSQNEMLFVNASLTLHHIQATKDRISLLQKLKSLAPDLLTLIEPDTNCHTDDFNQRLLNVYEHFNGLYLYINKLDLTQAEKSGLKQFFSTELFDAVALPDEHRFERYEPGAHWVHHAALAGFHADPESLNCHNIQIPDICVALAPEDYCSFSFQEARLLSTIMLR